LYANLCQRDPTSKPANWLLLEYRKHWTAGKCEHFIRQNTLQIVRNFAQIAL
jgi:hypothetical protein